MTLTNIKNKTTDRGFTIVELLIVIIVIGILATLVLIAYNNVQGQARDTKRQSTASSVASAAETYKTASVTGVYPRMDTGANFQSDINNVANYTTGVKAVSVDSAATTGIGITSTNAPSAGNPNNLYALFCKDGASSTYDQATGVKIGYWSETSKNIKLVATGTGAGSTATPVTTVTAITCT